MSETVFKEPRIALLSEEEAKAAAQKAGIPPFMARLHIFRVLLRNPKVAKLLNDLPTTLIFQGKLDAKLRELVILRLGWRTRSVYEWTQHFGIAKGAGLSEEKIVAVRDWKNSKLFSDAERAVLAAADETMDTGAMGEETWALCKKHVPGGDETLIELVAAIGNWRLFASVLRSLHITLEEGMTPWPPDGVEPPAEKS